MSLSVSPTRSVLFLFKEKKEKQAVGIVTCFGPLSIAFFFNCKILHCNLLFVVGYFHIFELKDFLFYEAHCVNFSQGDCSGGIWVARMRIHCGLPCVTD